MFHSSTPRRRCPNRFKRARLPISYPCSSQTTGATTRITDISESGSRTLQRTFSDLQVPVTMSELEVPQKQTRKRRSTGAMRESEEARKRDTIEHQEHSTRSISRRSAADGTETSLHVRSPSSSSTEPAIIIDDPATWDIEASIESVRRKFDEVNMERRRRREAIKTQTLRDVIDRNLTRCCRCRSFAATDAEGSCTDCFHARCSKCKHPNDLGEDRYGSSKKDEKLYETKQ